MTNLFADIIIYLLAVVIAVPLALRFGLGSVLGYLAAGIAIGPILGLVGAENAGNSTFRGIWCGNDALCYRT